MQEMEAGLVAEAVPFYRLRRRWSKAEAVWKQYVELYDLLCSVTHEDPDEQDRVNFANFQECYTNLHERVGDVLDNQKSEEEARLKEAKDEEAARLKALASKRKVDQLTTNLKAAYTHVDKKLEEIKAGLDCEVITCMEVLNLRENRLKQIKELLKESKSLVCSIIEEDPTQTATLVDEEGAKALEAETKISACEEVLAGFWAAIKK